MSNAWDAIQQIKSKRNSLRERLEKRKKERQDILGSSSGNSTVLSTSTPSNISNIVPILKIDDTKSELNEIFTTVDNGNGCEISIDKNTKKFNKFILSTESDPEIERLLLQILSDSGLSLPINSVQLIEKISSRRFKPVTLNTLSYFLQKFATQSYIT